MNLSGSWYNPGMNGTGFVIDDFDTGILLYWYNYSGGFSTLKDGQMWFLCTPHPDSRTDFHILRPEGRWNGAEFVAGDPIGVLSLEPEATSSRLPTSSRTSPPASLSWYLPFTGVVLASS